MMTFRETLEKEIATQGISVAEVAAKSQVSKGAIYNILNGTTEELRIRVATRRALAHGCGRELQVLPDGGVAFVLPGSEPEAVIEAVSSPEVSGDVSFRFLSFRPFFSQNHIAGVFDWLYKQEEDGTLSGLQIVDRVFQRREDFLSVAIENLSDSPVRDIGFDMHVEYSNGFSGKIKCQTDGSIAPRDKIEYTLFVLAGPAYKLALVGGALTNTAGQVTGIASAPTFQFEGDIS